MFTQFPIMTPAATATRTLGWTPELTTSEGNTIIRLDKIAALTVTHDGYLEIFTVDNTCFTVLANGGLKGAKRLRDELAAQLD
jgi:hypothetical protein